MDVDPPQTFTWWFYALLFGVFAVLSALFSAYEVAVFALGRSGRLRKKSGGSRHRRLRRLLDNSERTLATIQLGNFFVNIAAALCAARLGLILWPSAGWGAAWVGLAISFPVLLVVGEALARSVAIRAPERLALRLSSLLEATIYLLAPIREPLLWLASRLARSTLSPQQVSRRIQGEEEFKTLLSTSEVTGLLEAGEREMIDSVFEFAETTADEIMTPRTDIEGYPITLSQDEMIQALQQTPHSRVVIYESTPDRIVGVVQAKNVLLDPQIPWQKHLREPLLVPASMELDDLLTQFKRTHSRLAIVLDEFGGTAGLVTIHDLVEEIVGEMPDEEEETSSEIEEIEPGTYLLSGRIAVADCNSTLGTELPEDDARTVAGLIFTQLGRVPRVGEQVSLANARVRVVELEENRIERLELTLLGRAGDDDYPAKETESSPREAVL